MNSTASVDNVAVNSCFPKLMIDHSDGEVILFYENEYGVCVHPGTNVQVSVGEHRTDTYMYRFVDYSGAVTLTN